MRNEQVFVSHSSHAVGHHLSKQRPNYLESRLGVRHVHQDRSTTCGCSQRMGYGCTSASFVPCLVVDVPRPKSIPCREWAKRGVWRTHEVLFLQFFFRFSSPKCFSPKMCSALLCFKLFRYMLTPQIMRSYIDKSCGPRRKPIFVYLHKGVVAVEQSALRQSRNAPVPANKMQCNVGITYCIDVFSRWTLETQSGVC